MSYVPLDPARLRYHRKGKPGLSHPKKPPRHRGGEKFLKGPVPLPWLARAARLPGRSLDLGVALWFLAGLKRTRMVSLSNSVLAQFGVDRYAKYRALNWLERDGLVVVERHPGRNPVVTLLEAVKV